MIAALTVLISLVAGAWLVRSQGRAVDRGWRQLAAAVPEDKSLVASSYREDAEPDALAPQAKKALELLPGSRMVRRAQKVVAVVAAPLAATAFALFPLAALGPWSALVGAAWGLGIAAGLLRDDRKLMGAVTLSLVPLSILYMSTSYGWHVFPLWSIVGAATIYGAARRVLDQKDRAGQEEASRERDADPRFLIGSTLGRAASLARNRGAGGGDVERDDSPKGTTVT